MQASTARMAVLACAFAAAVDTRLPASLRWRIRYAVEHYPPVLGNGLRPIVRNLVEDGDRIVGSHRIGGASACRTRPSGPLGK